MFDKDFMKNVWPRLSLMLDFAVAALLIVAALLFSNLLPWYVVAVGLVVGLILLALAARAAYIELRYEEVED